MRRSREARCGSAGSALAAVVLLVTCVSQVAALPGDLDVTFGGDGKVTTDFGVSLSAASEDKVRAVLVLPSDLPGDGGKIVVAGYASNGGGFALARYNTNGTLDTTFDTDGKVTTTIFGGSGLALALHRTDSTYTLVVTGPFASTGSYDFAVARYLPNGNRDNNFSGDGIAVTDLNSQSQDFPTAVVVQSDGKIVVAGYTYSAATNEYDVALVRYGTDGALDDTFGMSGKVTSDFRNDDHAYAVATQPDGTILVAGTTRRNSDCDALVARYTATGVLDSTFASSGKVYTDIGGNTEDHIFAVARQSDGKIVVAGDSFAALLDFAVLRYTANGALDNTFGNNGKVITALSGGHDGGRGLALQPDGKIVVSGYRTAGESTDAAVVRYNSNGGLDTGFGSGGVVTAPVGTGIDEMFAVALQADGGIVAAGGVGGMCPAGCDCTMCSFRNPHCVFTKDFAVLRLLGN